MHELSIAVSMVEMAIEESVRRRAARVNSLHLKLGPLAGVVKEALLFSYEVACMGTPLENSQLIIEDIPVVIYCSNCEAQRTIDSIQLFSCPVCNELSPFVITGRELEFVAMEIEEIEEMEEAEDEPERVEETAA